MAVTEVTTQMKSPVLVELTIVTKGKFCTDALALTDVLIWKRKTGILRDSCISSCEDIATLGYEEVTLKVEVIQEFRLDTNVPCISHLPCDVRIAVRLRRKPVFAFPPLAPNTPGLLNV